MSQKTEKIMSYKKNKRDKEIRKWVDLLKGQYPLSRNFRQSGQGTWTRGNYQRNLKISLGIKYTTQNPQQAHHYTILEHHG